MARVTARTIVVAAALVLGAVACSDDPAPPDPARPDPAPRPEVDWHFTRVFGFRLYLPEAWGTDYRARGREEIHFSLPKDDGFRPQVQFHWKRKRVASVKDYLRRKARGVEAPGRKVVDDGATTVAGMPAHYVVYRQTARHEGRELQFLTVDFFFAGHEHVGMLRGVATLRAFLDVYRPLFFAVARRLVYDRT